MGLFSAYSRLSRMKKCAIVAGILILVYAVSGFFIAPPILKSQFSSRLSEYLGRPVTIEQLRINPFALSLTVRGFELEEPAGGLFVGFEELYVNFQVSSLLRRAYTFDRIELIGPHGLVKVLPDGNLNFSDLLAPSGSSEALSGSSEAISDSSEASSDQGKALPAVLIFHLKISQGRFAFSDLSRPTPFEATFSPVQITLEDFSTRPDSEGPYGFSASTGEGERLNWEGNFSVNPLRSKGRLELIGVKIRTLWEYLQDQVSFEVTGGSVDLGSAYHLDAGGDRFELKLTDGVLNLKDLKVSEKEGGVELVSIPSLSIEGADVDLSRKNVRIDSVRSEQARVKGWVDEGGVFNYSRLWVTHEEEEASKGETAASADSSVDTAPWVVTINELTLSEYGLDLEDRTMTPTLKMGLQSLAVAVKNLTTKEDAEAQFSLSLRFNETGTMRAEGSACMNPLSGKLDLEAGQILLKPFQPLVNSVSSIDLLSGVVNLKGDVQYRGMGETGPEIRWEGGLSILDFEAINRSYTEDFLKWESLEFNGILFDMAPNRLHLSEIMAKGAYARVIIWPDGSVNIKEAFSSQKGEQQTEGVDAPTITAVESKPEEGAMPVSVDIIRIEEGSANFADFSMKPNFFTGIQDLTGTIKGLSSNSSARADVSLSGKVDRYAPVMISGQINPLIPKAYVDMAMSFKNMELTPLTPYSGKFVGYTIEKGKLSVDLKYKLSENAIVGENVILLDQLTLGDRVESPDATNLPVKLAIALMRDTQGKIDIDLPVRGNLDDPEFSWGHLVIQALLNLVTKAVTAPFALLGSLFGGDGEELSFVEFEYGSESLLAQQTKKLDTLAQALRERPALQLQIEGAADSEYDRLALAEARLMEELRVRRFEELQAAGEQTIAKPEQITLTEEEFTRLLTEKYVETYGHDPFTTIEETSPEESGISTEPSEEGPGPPEIDSAVRMAMAKQRLIEEMAVDELALQRLAQGRATQIKGYLIEQGEISPDRLFALESKTGEQDVSDGEGIRVNLTLSGS
jgi:hypothetical protein